jgi:hypothetical protein
MYTKYHIYTTDGKAKTKNSRKGKVLIEYFFPESVVEGKRYVITTIKGATE